MRNSDHWGERRSAMLPLNPLVLDVEGEGRAALESVALSAALEQQSDYLFDLRLLRSRNEKIAEVELKRLSALIAEYVPPTITVTPAYVTSATERVVAVLGLALGWPNDEIEPFARQLVHLVLAKEA